MMVSLISGGKFLLGGSLAVGFSSLLLNDILPTLGVYGEPTAITSDDGSQIDIWVTDGIPDSYLTYYSYSTNGRAFAAPTLTDIPQGYMRHHVLKDGGTWYMYATGDATTDTAPIDSTIHLFTSANKINWTDQGQVLGLGTHPAWDHDNLGNTFVWKEGASSWYMIYDAKGGAYTWSEGLATASAPGGPWTKYGSNPILEGVNEGVQYGAGNPELPRLGSTVIKSRGRYYLYFHGHAGSVDGPINRAWSTDLYTWTIEDEISGVREVHGPTWTYGDHCLVQFQNHVYLFWTPSNQVDQGHVDGGMDGRNWAQLLGLPVNPPWGLRLIE